MGRGPAQVGATAAIALGFTRPFFAARTTIEAACPPPKITSSLSSLTPTMLINTKSKLVTYSTNHETNIYFRKYPKRRQSMDKHTLPPQFTGGITIDANIQ
jgi:hypothetical protein